MKKFSILLLSFCFVLPTFAVGTLEMSVSSYKGIVPKNGVRIPFLTIHAMSTNNAVRISEILVRRIGLSEDNDITRLIAITDNYRRSIRTGINDGMATLRFRKPIVVEEGEIKKITVYGNLQIIATSGRTIGLVLEGIKSTAKKIAPIEPKTIQTISSVRKRIPFKIVCKNRKCVRVKKGGNVKFKIQKVKINHKP